MRIKPTLNKATLRVFALAITAVMCTLVILSAIAPFPEGTWNFLSIGTSQKIAYAQEVGEVITLRTQQTKTHYLGNNEYAVQSGLGSVHYQDNGWQEIDNAWVVSSVQPWDYEMTKDSYRAYAYSLFNWGQIMKLESGDESVAFQPKDLQWANAQSQIKVVSIPQGVNAVASNMPVELLTGMNGSIGNIRWQGAYGSGRNFEWSATPGLLKTLLEINSALPSPPQYIIDGGDPALRLNFIFAPSSNLDIYVNGQLWNKSSPVQTVDQIEFRKDSESLWYFYPAKYWASGVNWTPSYIWTSPSSANGTGWVNPNNARDSNTVTYASISVPALQWSNYLTLSLNGSRLCDRVRIWSDGGAQINAAQVDVYYNGSWTNIYNGTLVKGSWQTYGIPSGNQTVSQARIRYWNSHASATRTAECHEFQFWASELHPEEQGTATTVLRSVGSDLWLDVLVPYKWIQTAVYPIYIDPDTGAILAGTGTNEDRDSKPYFWETPESIRAVDCNEAFCAFIYAEGYGDWLRASNFGFSVPTGATIDGVKVEINRDSYTGGIQDSSLRLVNDSGTNFGGDKASGDAWPYPSATKTYGGATDLWNTTITPSIFNDSDFGIRLSIRCDQPDIIGGYVDWVKITGYYTLTAVPEITNTPNNYGFGVLSVNTTSNTAINYFTLNNTGNCAVDVVIYGTDLTGGNDTWDLSDTATPGENIYGLYVGLDDADDLFDIIIKESGSTPYNYLVQGLAVNVTKAWGLKIYMPTSVSGYDAQQMSGTITLVASASS